MDVCNNFHLPQHLLNDHPSNNLHSITSFHHTPEPFYTTVFILYLKALPNIRTCI